MRQVNLNNAATSAIKPERSVKAMVDYLSSNSQNNPGRGSSLDEGRHTLNARLELCRLFGIKKPENIIFTPSVTYSLNMAINGLVRKGDHVITTAMEHNAVARPLELLKKNNMIELTYVRCGDDGSMDPADVYKSFRPNTSMVVMTHASNVTGTILPYEQCAYAAKERNAYFVLDAAQTAGYLDFDFDHSDIDVLAFTGHKSLMGPSGTGGFAIKDGTAQAMRPFITGGTGSVSHLLSQPDFMPDKFESGTPNMPGIIGLGAAVEYINEVGAKAIREHENELTESFIASMEELPVNLFCSASAHTQAPVVSITADQIDSGFLSAILYDDYGIITRSGLHCAPLAHKTLGTYPAGTVRFSFGYYNTQDEIDYAVQCIRRILMG